MSNPQTNYFQLFALPERFNIDIQSLEVNYRKIQSASHPDRFVSASTAEKLHSMQLATTANEGYNTLKKPATRAKYLLEQHGINAISDTNTAMPADFLVQQMEWRENLEDAKAAKDLPALEELVGQLQAEAKSMQAELADLLDMKKNYITATEATRKLIFIDKVCADVRQAIEQLE
jgi:molecular chaperone HscB